LVFRFDDANIVLAEGNCRNPYPAMIGCINPGVPLFGRKTRRKVFSLENKSNGDIYHYKKASL
jgi:hypothetical protein